MKKIMAMLVLALVFVGLTPLAFAQDQVRASIHADADDVNMSPRPVLISADGGEPKPVAFSADTEPLRDKSRLRVIAKERLETARERYATAKERYRTAKQDYADAKEELAQKRTRYRECEASDTAECVQVRRETKANTKDFLEHTADRIVSSLEKLKERVEMAEELSEEEAAVKIAIIEEKIDEVEAAKTSIDDLDNESTPEEIRAVVQEMKDAWQDVKPALNAHTGFIIAAKVKGVIIKSQKLSERLELAIEKLSERGYDTSNLEVLLDEFNAKIESAIEEHYGEATNGYSRVASGDTEPGEVSDIMREANRHMQAAQKDLRDAHAILVKILREIKSTKQGADALEDAEQELEEDEAPQTNQEDEPQDETDNNS